MLFRRKKEQTCSDERIVWGILVERRLQFVYKMLAAELRVPMSVLVGHVLRQWLAKNYETLVDDEQSKLEFGEYLSKKYLGNETQD